MRTVRAWWTAATVAAVVLAAAGAFLAWGPVGLGSGPLRVALADGGQDMSFAPHQNWGLFIMLDPRHAAVVIDHVTIRGGSGYPAPRVLSLWADRDETCAGAWLWQGQPGRPGLRRSSARSGLIRLGGRPAPAGTTLVVDSRLVRYPGEAVMADVAPPHRGCRVVTSAVIRYHVGIRHYAMTAPVSFAARLTGREVDTARAALDNL